LIVVDQFEQWLHAKKEEQNTELVAALRHCDGGRVQCIVMVRDDFWLAVSRFLRDFEIRLVEGQNSALADLFDTDHAKKVLAAFGRAFGILPDSGADIKRHMRSQGELLAASGYSKPAREFDELLRILGSELRLITPTDREGSGPEAAEPEASARDTASLADASGSASQRYYQLTHDYLVHSLRDWLT